MYLTWSFKVIYGLLVDTLLFMPKNPAKNPKGSWMGGLEKNRFHETVGLPYEEDGNHGEGDDRPPLLYALVGAGFGSFCLQNTGLLLFKREQPLELFYCQYHPFK